MSNLPDFDERSARTRLLLGDEGLSSLKNARVAIFGVGGVGSFAAEAIARAGVGSIDLFDGDIVAASNLNRQLVALCSTLGQPKARVMAQRINDINPDANVRAVCEFYTAENADSYPLEGYDYIIDAIDMVSAKLELIKRAKAAGRPIICAMGAGNKLDPTRFEVSDIFSTSMCPLARVMRRELKKMGITSLKVVYSKEEPASNCRPCGTVSFVPSSEGLIIAGEVIKDLCSNAYQKK